MAETVKNEEEEEDEEKERRPERKRRKKVKKEKKERNRRFFGLRQYESGATQVLSVKLKLPRTSDLFLQVFCPCIMAPFHNA